MFRFRVQMPMYEDPSLGGDPGGGGGGGEADPIRDAIVGSLEGSEPVVEQPKQQTPEEAAEEAELAAIEKEILGKNPQLKGNMPLHRHQAVLTRNRNQWSKAEQDYKAKVQKYEKDLAEWKRYEWSKDPQLHDALQALALAETDQKGFVDYLMKDPRFAELIDFKQKPQGQQPTGGERPGPDGRDADGNAYWTDAGLEKRLEWERQQTIAEAKKEAAKEREEWERQYKPVKDEFQARNDWNRALSEQRGVLENARSKWDGFREYESLIKKAMLENPEWDLKDAYIMTVPKQQQGKYSVEKEKVRQELIAEMNGKKGAVQAVRPGQQPERTVGESDDPIGDAIRASMRASAR